MPTTLTLKGIPDEIYTRLKHTAALHHRSLNSEAIFLLESALLPRKAGAAELIARARALREGLPQFSVADIDSAKRQGRR